MWKPWQQFIIYYFIVCIIMCTGKFNKYHRHIKPQMLVKTAANTQILKRWLTHILQFFVKIVKYISDYMKKRKQSKVFKYKKQKRCWFLYTDRSWKTSLPIRSQAAQVTQVTPKMQIRKNLNNVYRKAETILGQMRGFSIWQIEILNDTLVGRLYHFQPWNKTQYPSGKGNKILEWLSRYTKGHHCLESFKLDPSKH